MTDRELMQQVLEAFETIFGLKQSAIDIPATVETLRARLAQPEPEPVAWFIQGTYADGTPSFAQVCETDPEFYVPLYTAPPQREWQGLTHEEIAEESGAAKAQNHMILTLAEGFFCGARWAEAKLKEKNT